MKPSMACTVLSEVKKKSKIKLNVEDVQKEGRFYDKLFSISVNSANKPFCLFRNTYFPFTAPVNTSYLITRHYKN